jgi:hypothetical protein
LIREACRTANRNLSQAEWREYVGSEFDYVRICPVSELEDQLATA